MNKSLHVIIGEELERLDALYRYTGEWTAQEYAEVLKPLHEALLVLARGEVDTEAKPSAANSENSLRRA